jgi:hypothetical protein
MSCPVTAHGSRRSNHDKKQVIKHHFGVCHCWFNSHAGVVMSEYLEIINPQTMIGKLLQNGEVVAEYKMEQCDKCSILTKLDAFGYQKGFGNEKVVWFCKDCR